MGLRQVAYQPPDLNKPLPEYDLARQRANQSANAQKQTNQDALTREFSRIGGLNSGAFIKQSQIANDQSDQNQNQALEGINSQEAVAKRALDETQQARAFQTSERLGGQQFATGEREGAQKFATGEREAGQIFAGGQNQSARDLQERLANMSNNTMLKQLDQSQSQFEKQLALDTQVSHFNEQIAQQQANKPTDLFGSIFGPWASLQGNGGLGSAFNSIGNWGSNSFGGLF